MKRTASAFILALLFSALAVTALFGTSQASSSITLSVSTGEPGDSVTVSGTGFQPNSIVGIGFGDEKEIAFQFDLVDGVGIDEGPWYGYFGITPVKPTEFWFGNQYVDITDSLYGGNTTLDSTSSYFVNGSVWYVNATACRTSTSNLTGMIPYPHDMRATTYEISLTDATGISTDASGGFSTVITVPPMWDEATKITVIGNWGNISSGDFTVINSGVPTPSPTPTPAATATPYQEPEQTDQTVTIMGVAIIVAVISVGLGLLIYLIKRK